MERKLTEKEIKIFEWCLTLPEEYVSATDFEAEEAIKLDLNVQLPDSFSLGKWIYKTSNQWGLGACTSLWTTHWVQILVVKKNWVEPVDRNIYTPQWKDLWSKMWHSLDKYDWGDYVEKAVTTALKEWIYIEENWQLAKFDWYAYWEWNHDDKSIEMMKRYLYNWNPIVWCVRWDKKMWNEMTAGEIKSVPTNPTGWHCIALVGWDRWWLWFVNSRSANDGKWLKSRFYVTYDVMKKLWSKFNFRYWVLYIKEDALKDPEYLKRKNGYLAVIKLLKKYYPIENREVQLWIEAFSSAVRKHYPELNEELPK